jgi:hypothetical protein
MADRYLVQIDMARLRDNLSAAEKTGYTDDQIRGILKKHGFIEQKGGWLCEEVTLDWLDKSEIVSKREVW